MSEKPENKPNLRDDITAKVKQFVIERDEVLMSLDIDRVAAFYKKYCDLFPLPRSREGVEIVMHKARTAAKSLPMEARKLSKDWLSERGYISLDDGDI